jgi:hypothetical protein
VKTLCMSLMLLTVIGVWIIGVIRCVQVWGGAQ